LEAKFYRPYFEIIDNKIKINIGDIDPKRVISTITIEYLSQPILVDLQEDEIESDADTSRYCSLRKWRRDYKGCLDT
jgi:hypothetical protein